MLPLSLSVNARALMKSKPVDPLPVVQEAFLNAAFYALAHPEHRHLLQTPLSVLLHLEHLCHTAQFDVALRYCRENWNHLTTLRLFSL